MADPLWSAYLAAHPQLADLPDAPVSGFGDSPALRDELLALVLAGTKRATASLLWQYEADGDPVPAPGDHWVVTDGADRSRVVLRTVDQRIGLLESVDDAFAWDEGEGDRTRADWLRAHRGYFRRVVPPELDPETMDVLFERFAVVWPPEHVTDADRESADRFES